MDARAWKVAGLGLALVVATTGCGPVFGTAADNGRPAAAGSAPAPSSAAPEMIEVYQLPSDLCEILDYQPYEAMFGKPHGSPEAEEPERKCKQDLDTLQSAKLGDFYAAVTLNLYESLDPDSAADFYRELSDNTTGSWLDIEPMSGVADEAHSMTLKPSSSKVTAIRGLSVVARKGNICASVVLIAGRKKFSGELWTNADMQRAQKLSGEFVNRMFDKLNHYPAPKDNVIPPAPAASS